MEKIYGNFCIPIKPPKNSFTLEENEDMEFKLFKLKKVVERMKNKFKQELNALKYDIHSIKGGILNEVKVLHTLNSYTQEGYKKNKNVEFQSHIRKIEA